MPVTSQASSLAIAGYFQQLQESNIEQNVILIGIFMF